MTRLEVYQKSIMLYGFITLLFLLEKNKKEEKYEECAIILNVIKEHSQKYNLYLPTEFTDEAINEMKIYCMINFNLSGKIIEKNIPYYAFKIVKELNKVQ